MRFSVRCCRRSRSASEGYKTKVQIRVLRRPTRPGPRLSRTLRVHSVYVQATAMVFSLKSNSTNEPTDSLLRVGQSTGANLGAPPGPGCWLSPPTRPPPWNLGRRRLPHGPSQRLSVACELPTPKGAPQWRRLVGRRHHKQPASAPAR